MIYLIINPALNVIVRPDSPWWNDVLKVFHQGLPHCFHRTQALISGNGFRNVVLTLTGEHRLKCLLWRHLSLFLWLTAARSSILHIRPQPSAIFWYARFHSGSLIWAATRSASVAIFFSSCMFSSGCIEIYPSALLRVAVRPRWLRYWA